MPKRMGKKPPGFIPGNPKGAQSLGHGGVPIDRRTGKRLIGTQTPRQFPFGKKPQK